MKITVLISLVGVLLAAAARADEIHLYKGKSKTDIRVTSETYKEVEYSDSRIRGRQVLSASDVKEVVYENFSQRYELANEAMATGAFSKAIDLFESAAANAKGRFEFEQQYGLYNAAECYRAMGEFDKAIVAFDKLLSAVPQTKFYGAVYQRKAECYLAQKNKTRAEEVFKKLREEVKSKGLSPRWDILAEYHILNLNEGSDPSQSLAAYEDLQKRAGTDYPDVANLARWRIGYVLIQQGKIEDARAYFQDIIDERQASDINVVAGAYLGRGNTYVNKANAKPEDFQRALFDFLRVVVHYGDQLGKSTKVAEALYWAGRCLEMRGGTSSSDLAKEYYARVIKDYPSSEWARMAAER